MKMKLEAMKTKRRNDWLKVQKEHHMKKYEVREAQILKRKERKFAKLKSKIEEEEGITEEHIDE